MGQHCLVAQSAQSIVDLGSFVVIAFLLTAPQSMRMAEASKKKKRKQVLLWFLLKYAVPFLLFPLLTASLLVSFSQVQPHPHQRQHPQPPRAPPRRRRGSHRLRQDHPDGRQVSF